MDLLNKLGKVPRMLSYAENLLSLNKVEEALRVVQRIESISDLSSGNRLQCRLIKSSILTKLGTYEKSLHITEQVLQESLVLKKPLKIIDAQIGKIKNLWCLGRLEEALEIIQQCEQALENLGNKQKREISLRKASLFYQKGAINTMKGELNSSLNDFLQSMTLNIELGKKKEIAQCYNAISIIYQRKGSSDQALTYQHQALALKKELGDEQGMAASLLTLGYIYSSRGELDRALGCYQHSLKLKKNLTDKRVIAAALGNIGLIYKNTGDLDRALEYQEQSLTLSNELGNPQDIAIDLNNIGQIYALKGDLNRALDYHIKSLNLRKKIGNQTEIAHSLDNIGKIYLQKGDLNQALMYYKSSLDLFEEFGNSQDFAVSLENGARVYAVQGNYIQALEQLKQSLDIYEEIGDNLKISGALFSLVVTGLEKIPLKEIHKFLNRLRECDDREENKLISQRFRVAQALILKLSSRLRDRVRATELLEQVVEEENVDHELSVTAMLNLCDLLLKELRTSGEVMTEAKSIVNALLEIAKNQYLYPLLIETYLLKAKLALIELDVQAARQLLTQAQLLAEEQKLAQSALKVSCEHDKLLETLNTLDKFNKKEISLPELMTLAGIDEQLGHMIQRHQLDAPTLSPEEPIHLLILDESGLCVFSISFTSKGSIDDQLTGGFLNAIQSFSTHVFAQSIERVKLEEYTILMKHEDSFQVCYVFEGQSYSAQQKLGQFTEDIRNDSSVWSMLTEASRKRRNVDPQHNVLKYLLHKNFLTNLV